MRSILLLFCLLTGLVRAQPPIPEEAPSRFQSTRAHHAMVASAEAQATRAGLEVMRGGGNAVDAAVTTAFVLAVTLPSAGNLGGGGFLLLRTRDGQIQALDFRETAPAATHRDFYLDAQGQVDRQRITLGYQSCGVPGTVSGMETVLKRYGTISLRQAVEPARRLAAEGMLVTRELSDDLARVQDDLRRFPASAAIFLPGGRVPEVGDRLTQKDLAWSLEQIGETGSAAFYRGEVGQRMIASIQKNGGVMTMADLAAYRVLWRKPVEGTYRGFAVYAMPPPSSGGVHLVQMLNILEGYDLAALGHNSAATLHLLAEAMRSAYADRATWLGDPDFFKVPVDWLTSKGYATDLRAQIKTAVARKSSQVQAGKPPDEPPQTTHFSVVDDHGMAVSLTYTLNFSYGSKAVAEGTGILLNDEMDDFSAAPGSPNGFGLVGGEANSVQPGKRPLSSMTPTILEKEGQLVAVVGSPGGSRIITAVLQAILNVIDFHLNAQSAVAAPRVHHQWLPDELYFEEGISPDTLRLLRSYGHTMSPRNTFGHVQMIWRRPDGWWEGGTDPRRPGLVEGF